MPQDYMKPNNFKYSNKCILLPPQDKNFLDATTKSMWRTVNNATNYLYPMHSFFSIIHTILSVFFYSEGMHVHRWRSPCEGLASVISCPCRKWGSESRFCSSRRCRSDQCALSQCAPLPLHEPRSTEWSRYHSLQEENQRKRGTG